MAAPTTPTADTIVTEALNKAGYYAPATALKTRAKDYWLEEVKWEVWTIGKRLKSLMSSGMQVTTQGQHRYANPTNYSSFFSVELLDGSETGTAQTGSTSGTIKLAASADLTSAIIGSEIYIYAGLGGDQIRQITDYNNTTKVANITPSWTTTPDTTSKYMIIDTYKELTEHPSQRFIDARRASSQGTPQYFMPLGDADNGEFMIWPPPYRASLVPFGIRMRYFQNLLTLDLTSTEISTFYTRGREMLVQGVFAKALQNLNNERQTAEREVFTNMMMVFIASESYENTLDNTRGHGIAKENK